MNGNASSTSNPSGVQGVCPIGWHLPSDAEWRELTNYLGGDSIAGGKLKETGITHWYSPNTGATNKTEFTALPGGALNSFGAFGNESYDGFWWSATENTDENTWCITLNSYRNSVDIGDINKIAGLSVRCVKD